MKVLRGATQALLNPVVAYEAPPSTSSKGAAVKHKILPIG